MEAAESQPWKRVGVQRTLPRKKQTRFLKGCSSKELSSFSIKKIEDTALRHENIFWKPWSLILGGPIASFEAQLWPLTLAWPSLTSFAAPLVAVTAYESLVGLASPLLPLLYQEAHRVTGFGAWVGPWLSPVGFVAGVIGHPLRQENLIPIPAPLSVEPWIRIFRLGEISIIMS